MVAVEVVPPLLVPEEEEAEPVVAIEVVTEDEDEADVERPVVPPEDAAVDTAPAEE